MKDNDTKHGWRVTPKDAISIQHKLKQSVTIVPFDRPISVIAGADISCSKNDPYLYAGVIVFSYPDLEIIDSVYAKVETNFPYIPGLLSFREIPALLECFKKIRNIPDITIVDGHGIAHPRKMGIASHLGVLLNIPTIGCAKKHLYGVYDEPGTPCESSPLHDPSTHEIIGYAHKPKAGSNSLIISPGHLVSTDDALSIVKGCLRGYKLPEPTRYAHNYVNLFRKGLIEV